MKEFLFAIGGLALIFTAIWLFIKLIFHPILFELDLRNQGKKGISYIMTGILLASLLFDKIGKILSGDSDHND